MTPWLSSSRHQPRLYHLTLRLLKDPMEAEDALQEVFVKPYENAGRFEPQATVAAWLNRITANHCLNRLRQSHPGASLDAEEAPPVADRGPTPLEALEEQDLAGRLDGLSRGPPGKPAPGPGLKTLSPACRVRKSARKWT